MLCDQPAANNLWQPSHFVGTGPQQAYLRLLPNSPAFNTGTVTQFFRPQSVTKNDSFHEYIYNLGFKIGPGNPDAIPFTTIQNNSGAVRNVQIWADDSECPYAINFNREYPGPVLFKNVAVYGCKLAYSSGQGEYRVDAGRQARAWTAELGYRKAGWDNVVAYYERCKLAATLEDVLLVGGTECLVRANRNRKKQ